MPLVGPDHVDTTLIDRIPDIREDELHHNRHNHLRPPARGSASGPPENVPRRARSRRYDSYRAYPRYPRHRTLTTTIICPILFMGLFQVLQEMPLVGHDQHPRRGDMIPIATSATSERKSIQRI